MQRHIVRNVEEAVELALKFKKEGRYDWFRGQLQSNWKPSSSLERALARGESHEALTVRLERFIAWARHEPSLRYLTEASNQDQLFAVLQHYGFPTCYIDFSTDPGVAGFFASDCENPPDEGVRSVIFCLDSADLRTFYEHYVSPEFEDDSERLEVDLVSVNVDNLWRLQAQAGCFVFSNHSWYNFYDLNRIEFPWTGYPSFPSRDRIYPEHRSSLEQLLLNYFEDERRSLNNEIFLRDQSARTAVGQPSIRRIVLQSNGYDEEVFEKQPPQTTSWNEDLLKPWLNVPSEPFLRSVGIRHLISFRKGEHVPIPAKQLGYGIAAALRSDSELRHQAVQWEFSGLPEDIDPERLANMLREIWNGMRRLPYSDEDIVIACENLMEMYMQPGHDSCYGGDLRDAFQGWRHDALEIEFGTPGDSGSRGFCSGASLLEAVCPSWLSLLPAGVATSPTALLRLCYMPQRMMNFPRFAAMFGREVIPAQLVRGRTILHFNPARLDAFGLP